MGSLELQPALDNPHLLAESVLAALAAGVIPAEEVWVAAIDPALADTEALVGAYGVGLDVSANCVVVSGRRGERTSYAGCCVLATTRADVNGVVRRELDARKASFAPVDATLAATGMEYGGITPIGLSGGLAGARRRCRSRDTVGVHRERDPRVEAGGARTPPRRTAEGTGARAGHRIGGLTPCRCQRRRPGRSRRMRAASSPSSGSSSPASVPGPASSGTDSSTTRSIRWWRRSRSTERR